MLSATLCSDILAIRCINEHICIGVGNFLNVYEIKSKQLVAKLDVFEDDNIHSVVKGPDDQLFVHGGKSLCICNLEIADQVELKLSSVRRFDDWIIAIGWTRYERDTLFLSILFAHNNLRFYDTNDEKIQTVRCKEKCILYGGSVLTKNNGETIVFSGTVFQEILVWRAKYRDFSNDTFILHRLKGHKGVVFSVIYDPIINIISSTSDDRTTRVWKVKNAHDREVKEIIWEDCEINLTTTMYGHTARVWRSIVRDEKILTVGEDSHMCVWSIDGKLLDKVKAHEGAEIWSIDVSDDNKVIFTGGADGAVNVWPFESTKHPEGSWIYTGEERKVPKFIFYASNGNIFIFTDGGHLMIFNPRSKKINTSANLPRYSSYCVMEISLDRRKIALGSKEGYVDIYNEIEEEGDWKLRNIVSKKVTKTKILSLHWLSNETILICGVGGLLKLVDKIMETDSIERSLILPASRERWTTAAIVHKNYLICGDRAGSVYIFNLTHDYHQLEPVQVFSKIHGRLGVQSLAKSANRIISTGRDGTLRFYELEDESEAIRSLHLKKMPMDWVCKILQTNGDLYILGFKEVELIVYSMNLRRIVRRLVCGGGHRSWDCTIVDEKINFLYIRDKRINEIKCSLGNIDKPIINGYHTKEIYRVQLLGVSSSNHNILISAGEDSTLRVACIVESESKIQKYRIDTLAIYDGHASNVRSLEILNFESDGNITKNLVISGGGRAQLKIWEISVNIDSEKRLSSDDVTCKELSSYMLRGTDEDRKKKWQSVKPAFFVDPETRFMDISAIFHRENSNLVVIFVACSDGYLRTLLYDIVDDILHLSDTVNYCDRCALRIKTIEHENEIILMAMTTDGIVSFWRMSRSIENLIDRRSEKLPRHNEKYNHPFSKLTIHQSGINSFDLRKIDDSRWLLLTGGDDNLLSLVVIEISSEKNVCSIDVRKSWNSSSIHCAQITGTKFVDDDLMISTGIDQRVVVHSYAYVDDRLSVSRIEDTMTLIPDVQGLALHRTIVNATETGTLACVYGKGIEIMVLKPHTRTR